MSEGHRNTLLILGAISDRPRTTREIAAMTGLPPMPVSHCLTSLARKGRVRAAGQSANGNRRLWALSGSAS